MTSNTQSDADQLAPLLGAPRIAFLGIAELAEWDDDPPEVVSIAIIEPS
jgi:hypothetical protein